MNIRICRLIGMAMWLIATVPVRAEVVDIGSEEIAALARKGVPLIDIRTSGEWNDSGVVFGSHLLTFFDEQGRSDLTRWTSDVERFAGTQRPIALICRSGNRSGRLADMLARKYPSRTIYNVKDGMNGWLRKDNIVVRAEQNRPRVDAACTSNC